MTTILTMGHSNHGAEHLLGLVAGAGIEVVVDVRSTPASRAAPHTAKRRFPALLADAGVAYRFSGRHLGGRPDDPAAYDDEGFVDYAVVAAAAGFAEELDEVERLASARRVALLCGEEDPTGCHRRLLVGRVLIGRGHALRHVRGDGRVEDEAEVGAADPAPASLFDDVRWRSRAPVRRR
ncbi:MAG: DUF488 domain-containing protein [Actinomycetota bacterium]|nr:DUF488 domain-containing protein [Actinomycetota bacterium]